MGFGGKKVAVVLGVVVLLASVLGLMGCGTSGTTVSVAGSTTVQPLAEKWAEAFMAEHHGVKVEVQGGGTAVGIQSCDDGTVDIGAASRELVSTDPALVKHLLAKDAVAIVTNSKNALTGLTKDQVKQMFAGTITNWKEVGGVDARINLYAREEGSGTRDAFQSLVMGKDAQISAGANLQNSNGFLKTALAGDANGIGFLSLAYVDSSVKALAIDGVAATAANAKSGTYPIVRPLYFLTKQEPVGTVKEYIDFCTGPEGQGIVAEEGYLSIA